MKLLPETRGWARGGPGALPGLAWESIRNASSQDPPQVQESATLGWDPGALVSRILKVAFKARRSRTPGKRDGLTRSQE